MNYFSTLPGIAQVSDNGQISTVLTNLVTRVSMKPEFINNPVLFYEYDIQDSDNPEIIAHKYYRDSYRYWIILLVNNIFDPVWEWPLNTANLDQYINDKYKTFNPLSTVHHYEKIITSYEHTSQTTSVDKVVIDESTYNILPETTNTYALPTGEVTVTITKRSVSYYEYEVDLNETKRHIKLLNSMYVDDFESEFKKLMKK
jgi:hypothetical protein